MFLCLAIYTKKVHANVKQKIRGSTERPRNVLLFSASDSPKIIKQGMT